MLEDHQNGTLDHVPTNKELWKAQTCITNRIYIILVKQSAVHPQDGHIIPWYSRQCGYMPTNLPIILGFTLSPPTVYILFIYFILVSLNNNVAMD